MVTIHKYLQSSFDLIDKINGTTLDFKIKIARTTTHVFSNRKLTFKRSDNDYTFHTTTQIKKGIQRQKELELKRETEIELYNDDFKLYSKGKNFIINHISYGDINEPIPFKNIEGQLTSISTKQSTYYKRERFYRIIFPLNKKVGLFGDFTGWHYSIDEKSIFETLVKLEIAGNEYHFFTYNNKAKECFFVIDSTNKLQLDNFLRIANSILLSYAFLKGDYHGKQAYIFSYSYKNFKAPSSLSTMMMAGEIYGGFAIHSTKPLSIVQMQNKIKYKKDKAGKIIGTNTKWSHKYMVEFPSECLSKLCELIYTKGGVLRAVILFVNNHKATLELKVPALFVAIENITKVLVGGDKVTPLIIEDKDIIDEIKKAVKKSVKEVNAIKRNHKPEGLNPVDEKAYNADFARIASKLHGFNQGSNNKKLSDPFPELGYTLTAEEKELLIRDRNKFLHGDDYSSLDDSYDSEFRELFHISMRLQKLIAVLLLKQSGYSGYILNNAKIYDYISQKSIKESVFVEI